MKLTTNNNNVKEKVISMSHVDEQHSCLMSIFYDGTSLSQYPLPTRRHKNTKTPLLHRRRTLVLSPL